MLHTLRGFFVFAATLLCSFSAFAEPAASELVVYSGRSRSLVDPLLRRFEKETGIRVRVQYGNTAQLALTLLEEGGKSPADIFWAQDAGALGAVTDAGNLEEGLFSKLRKKLTSPIPQNLRNDEGTWIPTSGRARLLAYSSKRVSAEDLPASVFDLTDPKWKGRVGWAPTNGSFQTFVTAMRVKLGEQKTKSWLLGMKKNGAKKYAKNTPIIQALAAGEIDVGLPNHYYLLRFKKNDSEFPVEQVFFSAPGDIGNLINVAGVGVLKSSKNRANAIRFVEFLLSAGSQSYFTNEVFEFPVNNSVKPHPRLVPLSEIDKISPKVDLDALMDLEGTLKLLRETGLI